MTGKGIGALAFGVATIGLIVAWGPLAPRRTHSLEARVDASIAQRDVLVSPDELLTLCSAQRERLFDEDVLPRMQCLLRQVIMRRRWGSDRNGLDRLVGEDILELLCCSDPRML